MLAKIFDYLLKKTNSEKEFIPAPLMPRSIELDDSVFHFSMPENFSKDMPGEDLIEKVVLSADDSLNTYFAVNLLNRWWDYFVPVDGELLNGTTRFSIDVLKQQGDLEKLFLNIPDLIEYEDADLRNYYSPINDKYLENGEFDSEVLLPSSPEQYRRITINKSDWVNYTLYGGKTAYFYLFALNNDYYLKIGFHFSPANHFSSSSELRSIMLGEVERIVDTFYVERSGSALIE